MPLVAVDSMIIDLLDENLHVEVDIAEAIEALEPPPISLSPSAYAVYWLVASPPRPHELLFRIGYVSAVFCAIAVLGFCWAAFVAHLALKRGWSPRTCIKAGWPFIPLALIAYVTGSQFWRVAGLFADSYPISFADETCDIAIGGVMRNAR